MPKLPSEIIAEINALSGMKASRMHRAYDATFPDLRSCHQCKILRAEIAYRLQAKFYDVTLTPAIERLLLQSAGDEVRLHEPTNPPKAGTRLLREWKGKTYEVILREDGRIEYNGRYWRSLSAVARDITGTNWNGKIFFGIK